MNDGRDEEMQEIGTGFFWWAGLVLLSVGVLLGVLVLVATLVWKAVVS